MEMAVSARVLSIAGEQFPADGRAGQHGFFFWQVMQRFRKVAADFAGGWKGDFIGKAGRDVGFVYDNGNMTEFCRQNDRNGDKTAFGEDKIGF